MVEKLGISPWMLFVPKRGGVLKGWKNYMLKRLHTSSSPFAVKSFAWLLQFGRCRHSGIVPCLGDPVKKTNICAVPTK
jgi:hypothetical protein